MTPRAKSDKSDKATISRPYGEHEVRAKCATRCGDFSGGTFRAGPPEKPTEKFLKSFRDLGTSDALVAFRAHEGDKRPASRDGARHNEVEP
jgi:hypothetical protein